MRIAVCIYGDPPLNNWWEEYFPDCDVFMHSFETTPEYDLKERSNRVEVYGHLSKRGHPTQHPKIFDSMRRVLLKCRNHAISSQEYDYIILTRGDIIVDGKIDFPQSNELVGEIDGPVHLPRSYFGRRIIVGKPPQIDMIGYMWNALHMITSGVMDMHGYVDPDQTIHFYLSMMGVQMRQGGWTSKIVRSSKYGERSCDLYGGLRRYETL